MRVLIERGDRQWPDDLTDGDLAKLYAVPSSPWLRANMVTTVDGAATGLDGLSGTINNPVDKRVFHLLRGMLDAILVGAGTARAEGYGPAVRPLVVVSRLGHLPSGLSSAEPGSVLMATCRSAAGLAPTRRVLGDDDVLVLGEDSVDLTALRRALAERGMTNLLCEGGPRLLNDLLAASLVDELCLTQVACVVGGQQPRISPGQAFEVSLQLGSLIEAEGTLLGRWLTVQSDAVPAADPA